MDRLHISKNAIALLALGTFYSPAANLAPYEPRPAEECSHLARGTTEPNTSGSPTIISPVTGTVISANFFNSGAIIYSPYFDGNEFVSVCVIDPDLNDSVIAEISTDVALRDDTLIKAYPEFIFGSKFGNQFETSFRYYNNTGLPLEHQWPVKATNNATSSNLEIHGYPFEFANLEYVSQVKGIGLPAFTNALPQIDIVLNMSEENVVGAERDVMLESWFYDTSANADLIGNNAITGQPIANTLNNIVSTGHRHFDQLNNTLLEMMVHLGPLSPNDISNATRNPGQFQLTENYSGTDYDGDGIDDHFDVDSHNNVNTSPGLYSSGIDANGDGIDDADILPVTIGDYQYSIWYGTNGTSPLVVYSRETNSSLTNDFDPLLADMNLSKEGDIYLDWNLFLDYTINEVQVQLQTTNVSWANGPNNLFDKIRAPGSAISGLEIGVEPQINNPTDEPYTLSFSKLEVDVDGIQLGLNAADLNPDTSNPTITIDTPSAGPVLSSLVNLTGTSSDNIAIDRNRLLIRNTDTGDFWNGAAWTDTWAWFAPTGIESWSYNIELPDANYTAIAWTWDTSDNRTKSDTISFSVSTTNNTDTTPPNVIVVPPVSSVPGIVTVSGSATDASPIDRTRLFIRNSDTGLFWNGSAWTNNWAWFDPSGTDTWAYDLTLAAGNYTTIAWAWDSSDNRGKSSTQSFAVSGPDTTPPTVNITGPVSTVSAGQVTINIESNDDTNIDRNRILVRNVQTGEYWNGQQWIGNWAWFSPASGTPDNASHTLSLTDPSSYRIVAWTWDTSNNQSATDAVTISVF